MEFVIATPDRRNKPFKLLDFDMLWHSPFKIQKI